MKSLEDFQITLEKVAMKVKLAADQMTSEKKEGLRSVQNPKSWPTKPWSRPMSKKQLKCT
jgi:hypothetical protein